MKNRGSFAAKVDFATVSAPSSVAIGDLDGDGKPDLAIPNNYNSSVSVYRNTSSSGSIVAGSFVAKAEFAIGFRPQSVTIGDLDGDGKADLAVANYGDNSVSVLRNADIPTINVSVSLSSNALTKSFCFLTASILNESNTDTNIFIFRSSLGFGIAAIVAVAAAAAAAAAAATVVAGAK